MWLNACGEGKPRLPATSTATPEPAVDRVATRGGVVRAYSFDALQPDALDPHMSLMGPVANVHAAVFSRLLRFEDERAGIVAPDLAASMPEQPDKLTYIIELRQDARFHDAPKFREAFPGASGRAVQAGDIKASFERQIDANARNASRFYGAALWSAIDSVRTPSPHTVVIQLKTPVAPFAALLAGKYAFVLPKEVASLEELSSDVAMIGSGPFMLDGFEPGMVVRLRRSPGWFRAGDDPEAGSGRPFVDGIDAFFAPQEDAFQLAAFERKAVDATSFADPRTYSRALTTNLQDIVLDEADGSSVLASRMLVDRPPFSDDRIRHALHLAVDRRAVALLLYPQLEGGAPSARLSGPIAPGSAWALREDDLLRRDGYVPDRDRDIAQARALWSAAGADKSIQAIQLTVAGQPRRLADVHAALARQLSDALAVQVSATLDASGTALLIAALRRNVEDATEGVVPLTLAFEDGGVDLDAWVYQYRSGQPANTFRLQDATLDAMLDRQRGEFDLEARRQQGIDIQDYLLSKVNARLEYLAPRERRIRWGYVRNWRVRAGNGAADHLEDAWLDTEHVAWKGRGL